MTQATYELTGSAHQSSSEASRRTEVRMPRWQSFLIALGSLVLVFGLGTLVMVGGGAVIHALRPTRHVDTFAALHNQWVVGVLLGIAVLWLLPPHRWVKRVIESSSQEQPAQLPVGAEDGDAALATGTLQ